MTNLNELKTGSERIRQDMSFYFLKMRANLILKFKEIEN
jgi:hypothetical protein